MPGWPRLRSDVRVHEEPRISAAKLAEYLVVLPTQHDVILHNSKFVSAPIVDSGRHAKDAIIRYSSDPNRSPTILQDAIDNLELRLQNEDLTPQTAGAVRANIEAIQRFMAQENALGMRGMPIEEMGQLPRAPINGVSVSCNPHFYRDYVGPRGGRRTSAGWIRTSKAPNPEDCQREFTRDSRTRHRTELAWYLLAITIYFAERHESLFPNLTRSEFFVSDIYLGQTLSPPPDVSSRMRAVEAVCSQIADRWDAIQPLPILYA